MILLDTNVVSELMRQTPDEQVFAWLDKQPQTSVWITSITVLEIQYGLEIIPAGKRRALLLKAFEALWTDALGRRVVPFDTAAAQHAAALISSRHKTRRPMDLRDTMIAGIAIACHATLATRNVSHFDDLSVAVVNPWMNQGR